MSFLLFISLYLFFFFLLFVVVHLGYRLMLSSFRIGVLNTPIQTIQIHNVGDSPTNFQLDTSQIEQLKADNFDFDIFQCMNTTGVIPARGFVAIDWLFTPLQAIRYSVEVRYCYL